MEPKVDPVVSEEPTSGLALAISWLFVGVPLLWGVSQTFIKALALFQ
ncbi:MULTISPECIES: MFS transporter small subunit [Hymenobacter]|uniref:Oxalate:formate antiporter n=1 Tax=Hymenobacter jejuensis TaxID=2502781 RepID=A0A5B8A0V2_9BACT|nr:MULTISPECIES: oxalate:formate antiporter [Hymenobacter]MBC6991310.1 oxalate:formate antiporter [Hymenobacter sp. BT491]QDA60325.1 oxalate:formate antiporter [Hymenobacter jejuensis]